MYKYLISHTSFLIAILALTGCSEMDATYKEFLEDGEIIYTGKADSLRAHPGYYRIGLSWLLMADPKVSSAKLYWNNRQDSMSVALEKSKEVDTVSVLIEDLEERAYTFEVFTFDEDGNSSVRSEVLGTVYGDLYAGSVLSRVIKSMAVVDGDLVLEWMPAEDDAFGDEVLYTDRQGTLRSLFAASADDSTWLEGFPSGGDFTYRSLFLPDSLAIDTFYTDYVPVETDPRLFETELDKSEFEHFPLPTDTYEPYSSDNNSVDKIWDRVENKDSPSFLTAPGSGLPQWFTFDIGTEAQLRRIKIYQRGTGSNRLYEGGNVKKWEIWGATDPNPDGSWDDSWTLLLEGESVKPSGSPPGEMTEQDLDYILDGEEYVFPGETPPVRYIRFKTLDNWDSQNREYVNIGQITLWGEETGE